MFIIYLIIVNFFYIMKFFYKLIGKGCSIYFLVGKGYKSYFIEDKIEVVINYLRI